MDLTQLKPDKFKVKPFCFSKLISPEAMGSSMVDMKMNPKLGKRRTWSASG